MHIFDINFESELTILILTIDRSILLKWMWHQRSSNA